MSSQLNFHLKVLTSITYFSINFLHNVIFDMYNYRDYLNNPPRIPLSKIFGERLPSIKYCFQTSFRSPTVHPNQK